jgi:hypothetical protein
MTGFGSPVTSDSFLSSCDGFIQESWSLNLFLTLGSITFFLHHDVVEDVVSCPRYLVLLK